MWLITPGGFFSIVEKPGDRRGNTLTLRARVRSDLADLKRDFLPSLGPIRESADTDYRYRATAPRADVAAALARMVGELGYDNFKSEVARRQGMARAHLYHGVWDVLHRMQGDPAFEAPRVKPAAPSTRTARTQMPTAAIAAGRSAKVGIPKADTYGGVLINDRGEVQLREPTGHYGRYVWTFAKGQPEPGETPEATALREVREETGQKARIITVIPEAFAGTTSSTVFFLMAPIGKPRQFSEETATVRWVDEKAARLLISKTTARAGRERDLAVLDAALAAWRARI